MLFYISELLTSTSSGIGIKTTNQNVNTPGMDLDKTQMITADRVCNITHEKLKAKPILRENITLELLANINQTM